MRWDDPTCSVTNNLFFNIILLYYRYKFPLLLTVPNRHHEICMAHKIDFSLPTDFFLYARVGNRIHNHLLKGLKPF
jgi:hypothetical protein